MKSKINFIIDISIYALIILSLWWGSILAIFSFREFIISFKFSPDVFQIFFGVLGLSAWLNGVHYIRRIHRTGVTQIWKLFYKKDKRKIITTAILMAVFLFLITVGKFILLANNTIEKIMQIIQIPWIVGGQLNFLISLYVRRFITVMTLINNFGWLINFFFQMVAFFYISRIIYWRPKLKKP